MKAKVNDKFTGIFMSSKYPPQLVNALSYILNEATRPELEAITEAVGKRADYLNMGSERGSRINEKIFGPGGKGGRGASGPGIPGAPPGMPGGGGPGGPAGWAQQMAQDMMQRFTGGQNPKDMGRNIVRQMLENYQPRLSEGEIETLVEHFTQPKLPEKDVLEFMVVSFVEYCRGNMEKETADLIERKQPGWRDNFWDAFPEPLKAEISKVINGRQSLEDVLVLLDGFYESP